MYKFVYFIYIIATTPFATCKKTITIVSDFENDADKEFFNTTFPWLVKNIGFELNVKFHFLDSGTTSGPRKCVLKDIDRNIYLQASYLECVGNGKENEECIKSLPIDMKAYSNCLKRNTEGFVREAEREYRRMQIDSTPAVQIDRINCVSTVEPIKVLNLICKAFGRNLPRNCLKSLPTPENTVPANDNKNGKDDEKINGDETKNDDSTKKEDEEKKVGDDKKEDEINNKNEDKTDS